jgi:molybdopterin molybdotransferase
MGMTQSFYKVAMRPGKPLMAGLLEGAAMIGLPGNPVSAMVCGTVFVAPMIRAMLGLGHRPAPRRALPLGRDMAANGPREHYMRATLAEGAVIPENRQDSSLLSVLAAANVLMVRAPHDPALPAGTPVEVIDL